MPLSAEEEARQVANALNALGHLAQGHPLEETRRSLGDAKMREQLQEAATLCFQLVQHTGSGTQPEVFPSPDTAQAALSHLRNMLPSLDFDDARSMAQLRAHARQALEALGFQLPE
jgi:hypothetical protein